MIKKLLAILSIIMLLGMATPVIAVAPVDVATLEYKDSSMASISENTIAMAFVFSGTGRDDITITLFAGAGNTTILYTKSKNIDTYIDYKFVNDTKAYVYSSDSGKLYRVKVDYSSVIVPEDPEIATLRAEVENHESEIANLTENNTALATALAEQSALVGKENSTVASLTSTVSSQKTEISTLTTSKNDLQGNYNVLRTEHSELAKKYEELENKVEKLKDKLSGSQKFSRNLIFLMTISMVVAFVIGRSFVLQPLSKATEEGKEGKPFRKRADEIGKALGALKKPIERDEVKKVKEVKEEVPEGETLTEKEKEKIARKEAKKRILKRLEAIDENYVKLLDDLGKVNLLDEINVITSDFDSRSKIGEHGNRIREELKKHGVE